MFTVDYNFFNQPMRTRRFATRAAAIKFIQTARNDRRVKYVELTCSK